MAMSKMLMRMGKLRTAMRILLLLAREAIPEISVRAPENPIEVSRSVRRNNVTFWMGLSMKILKRIYPAIERMKHNSAL